MTGWVLRRRGASARVKGGGGRKSRTTGVAMAMSRRAWRGGWLLSLGESL